MSRLRLNRVRKAKQSLDGPDTNTKILSLLLSGCDNKEISSQLGIPLSTVQRKTRNILLAGILQSKIHVDFKRLGLKKGQLHVCLSGGNIEKIIGVFRKIKGVLSCAVHVGNSDIIGEFIYKDSEEIINTISLLKNTNAVKSVLWSEELYSVQGNAEGVAKLLGRKFRGKRITSKLMATLN